jgi:hypothetical protein
MEEIARKWICIAYKETLKSLNIRCKFQYVSTEHHFYTLLNASTNQYLRQKSDACTIQVTKNYIRNYEASSSQML